MPFNKKDFEQRLEDSGIIPIVGEINSNTASRIIFKLLAFSTIDEKREIQLYFSSTGGSYLDVMAIYDTLSAIKNPVVGVCVGCVSGYATLLLAKCSSIIQNGIVLNIKSYLLLIRFKLLILPEILILKPFNPMSLLQVKSDSFRAHTVILAPCECNRYASIFPIRPNPSTAISAP